MFIRRQYNPIELNKLGGKRARGKERDTKKKRERKKERKKLGWPSLFCYLPFNANCMREMKERIYAQRKWKRIECEKKNNCKSVFWSAVPSFSIRHTPLPNDIFLYWY